MNKAFMNQQMTEKDLLAWMDDFLNRLLLCVMHEHQVVNQDGTTEEKSYAKGAGQ